MRSSAEACGCDGQWCGSSKPVGLESSAEAPRVWCCSAAFSSARSKPKRAAAACTFQRSGNSARGDSSRRQRDRFMSPREHRLAEAHVDRRQRLPNKSTNDLRATRGTWVSANVKDSGHRSTQAGDGAPASEATSRRATARVRPAVTGAEGAGFAAILDWATPGPESTPSP